ncbi:MAG: hypothetical protein NVS1B10_08700 [Candidatus Saccharimonadales bacterium]
MIQFNLLPDIKLEYIKARRIKRLVMFVSSVITAVAVAVFIVLLLDVFLLQHKHLKDLNRDVADKSAKLKAIPDLDKILTVQNQLNTLPTIQGRNPVASRLFTYITQLTPAQATIQKLAVDFSANTMTISGSTDNLVTINKFVDTLKFTTYKKSANDSPTPVLANIVLGSFTLSDKGKANYSISTSFDPAIFNSANEVILNVPNIISTRSALDKPTDLFQQNTNP